MKVPLVDLSWQYKKYKKSIDSLLKEAIRRGDFILGRDTAIFENDFARYCKRKFAIGVNSGTDALFLGLKSLGIGPGDEVIVPVFTYIASALAVSYTGARPVFVDIDEKTYNIDATKIKSAISTKTKAIIPVHLYGQTADMAPILNIAKEYGLKIIEDAAQAHGAKYKSSAKKWLISGSMGDIGCFSFYPTKNLGAFGDGGMIVTDDEGLYKKLLMLRDYGRRSRYEHITLGYNSRLDTLQAAILRQKLKHLDEWNNLRRESARVYTNEFKSAKEIITPFETGYSRHVYHIYAVRLKNRDSLIKRLAQEGIGALVHYPIPLHLQEVYKDLGYKNGDFPVAEEAAQEVLSLPMYPYLKEEQIRFVAKIVKKYINN